MNPITGNTDYERIAIEESLRRMQLMQDASTVQKPYMAEQYQYLRELTDISGGIPEGIKLQLWSFTNKVLQLSNITESEKKVLLNQADLIIDYLEINTPVDFKGPMYKVELRQMKLLFYTAINRAVGGFERIRQGTTTNEGAYKYVQGPPTGRRKLLGII
jgi:hypothetical protein